MVGGSIPPLATINVNIAQLVEQRTENPCVNSSILFIVKCRKHIGLYPIGCKALSLLFNIFSDSIVEFANK